MKIPIIRTIQAYSAGYGRAAQAPLSNEFQMCNIGKIENLEGEKFAERQQIEATLSPEIPAETIIEAFCRSWNCIAPLWPLHKPVNTLVEPEARKEFRICFEDTRNLFLARARFWKYLKQESAFGFVLTVAAYLYKPNALLAIPGGALALLYVSAHQRRSSALDRALASELIKDAHLQSKHNGEVSPDTVHCRYVRPHETLKLWREEGEGIVPDELIAHLERRLPDYDWDTRA